MFFNRILVPVDYSEHSQRALELALKLGARDPVDVVHVWDRPQYTGDAVVTGPDGSRRALAEMIRENAEADMTQFLARVHQPAGAALERRLITGDPVSALLEILEQRKHDLVVICTHGRTGMQRILLGSVTERLIRLSPVPVLTVPRAPA